MEKFDAQHIKKEFDMSKNEKKYPKGHWMGIGISIGVVIGVALGPAFDNIAIGIAVGIAIGSGIGASLERKYKNNIRPPTEPEKKRQRWAVIAGLLILFAFVIAIAILVGRKLTSVPASNDPDSIPNTTTPIPIPDAITHTPSVTSSNQTGNAVLLHTFSGHRGRVLDVAFSAQGEFLASSSQDMNIKLWDIKSGQEMQSFRMSSVDMADIDISVDRNLLASAEAIWDLENMQEIHELERGLIYPGSVAFSPDGSTIALGIFEQQITLWDVTSGQPLYTFEQQEEKRTKSMDFSPDGSWVAAGVIDGTVRVFDVASGKIVKTLKYSGETDIHHVVFSPDGRYLATGGRVPAVILWDVASGKVVRTFRLTDNAISMDFSPDGMILATAGGSQYEVRLWDVESGTLLLSLPHDNQLTSVAFSPDGKLLAVGCFDSNIYLWEIPTNP
jgi:WD40 repeat protein